MLKNKLLLGKETIANLNAPQLRGVKGGEEASYGNCKTVSKPVKPKCCCPQNPKMDEV